MQAADTIRIVPCFEGGGKLSNKCSVKVIHTASVHTVRFCIFAYGFSFDIPFPEICAVAFKYRFEAVVQKCQILFENIELVFTPNADVPLLCHAQIVSAQINLVIGAEIFCVVGVGFGATVPTRLVCEQVFILRFLLSHGAFKAAVV